MNSIKRDKNQTRIQLAADYLSALLAWTIYFTFRKIYLEPLVFGYEIEVKYNNSFYLGLAVVPLFWMILYHVSGTYFDIYRKSRLGIIGSTTWLILIGSIVLFFVLRPWPCPRQCLLGHGHPQAPIISEVALSTFTAHIVMTSCNENSN